MTQSTPPQYETRPSGPRVLKDRMFQFTCVCAAAMAILILCWLLFSISAQGAGVISWDFLTSLGSKDAERAGFLPPIVGSILLMLICAGTAIPLGVGTAILLEEFKPGNRFLAKLHSFVQMNITNLAGVPSIVYGILGLTAFASMFGLLGSPLSPSFAIGQKWYHEYADFNGNLYYVSVPSGDTEVKPVAAEMVFRAEPSRSSQVIENISIQSAEELEPIQEQVDASLSSVKDSIKDALDDTRETRRGPVIVDAAAAEKMVEAAFAGQSFNADIDTLKGFMTAELQKLDGLASRALRSARGDMFDQLVALELKALDLKGVFIAGTLPSVKDEKSWYFLQLPFGRGILAGGLTLMLVILPVIIVASQEAIRAVPQTMRQGSLALGSTKWQAVAQVVLPAAVPGIMTGTILAMSRAIGEAAPILMLGGVFITFLPSNAMDGFTAMPLQIYNWAGKPQEEFKIVAAGGIIVLLVILLSFNAVAVYLRQKTQKDL